MRAPAETFEKHDLWGNHIESSSPCREFSESASETCSGTSKIRTPTGRTDGLDSSASKPGESQQETPLRRAVCACCGNCGNRSCMTRKRSWHSSEGPRKKAKIIICENYCEDLQEGSRQYCRDCSCSMIDCGLPRTKATRFCSRITEYMKTSRKGVLYELIL